MIAFHRVKSIIAYNYYVFILLCRIRIAYAVKEVASFLEVGLGLGQLINLVS